MNEAAHSIKATNPMVDQEALFPPCLLAACLRQNRASPIPTFP